MTIGDLHAGSVSAGIAVDCPRGPPLVTKAGDHVRT